MKTKKRIIQVFLTLFIICATVSPASAKTNYKKIYGNLLKRNVISYSNKDFGGIKLTYHPAAFVLLNIDQKGPKELIVTNEYRTEWHIYTIKNNKVKHIFSKVWMGSDGDGVFYNRSKKGLVRVWSDGTGLINRCLFCFKNGKQSSKIHLYSSWIYGTNPARFNYSKNGKGIAKKTFDKYFNKYFKYTNNKGRTVYVNTKFYSYIENTASNRSKVLK